MFCFCIRLVLKRHTPRLLVVAAVTSYTLSAVYVILDLWRVGTSYTVNPESPFSITYTSNYHQPLAHAAAYIYIVEVRSLRTLFLGPRDRKASAGCTRHNPKEMVSRSRCLPTVKLENSIDADRSFALLHVVPISRCRFGTFPLARFHQGCLLTGLSVPRSKWLNGSLQKSRSGVATPFGVMIFVSVFFQSCCGSGAEVSTHCSLV